MEKNYEHGLKFIVIKVRDSVIKERGTRYEATRRSWRLNKSRASKYRYVLSVTDKKVYAVYYIDNWIQDDDDPKRFIFEGHEIGGEIANLFINQELDKKYTLRGMRNPVLYSK